MSKKITIMLWIVYILAMSIYWFRIGGQYEIILRNTIYLGMPLIATIAGIFSLSLFGFKGFRATTLLCITLGLGCWFIGEVLFYYYEFVLKANPFPTIADFFYLLAYPLIFLALFNEIRHTKVNVRRIHPAVIFLFCIATVALIFLVSYFGVYLAYDPHEALFNNLIAMGYGIGDLLLIMGDIWVLILAWEFRKGTFSYFWIFLFIGFICMLVADILFAIYTDQYKTEVWFYKSLLDSFWMASYLLFANALFDFGASLLSAKSQLKNIQLQKEATK